MKKEVIQGTTEKKTKLKNGGKVALAALALTGMSIADMGCSQQPTITKQDISEAVSQGVAQGVKQALAESQTTTAPQPIYQTQPYQPTYQPTYQQSYRYETVYQPEYAGDFPRNQQEAANTWGYDDFTRNPGNWNQISGGWSCISDVNRQFNLSRFGVDGSRREYNGYYQYDYNRRGYWSNGQWYDNDYYNNGGREVGVVAFNVGIINLKGGSFYKIQNQQEAYDLYNKVVSYHPGTTILREGF